MTGPLRALRELGVSFRASDVLVLCYHHVRSRERFHGHMSILLDRGYSVLTMDEFIAWLLRRCPIRSPAVLLTFDGGYRSQLDNALPVLETLEMPATFLPLSSGLDLDDAEVSGRELAARRPPGTRSAVTPTHTAT